MTSLLRTRLLLASLLITGLAACSAPPESGLQRNPGSSEDDDASARLPPKSDGSGSISNGNHHGLSGALTLRAAAREGFEFGVRAHPIERVLVIRGEHGDP